MDIFTRISASLDDLSKTNRKIAAAVLHTPEALAFSTLRTFAETLDVSTTSVIRFARLFGFDGYEGLRSTIRDAVMQRMGSMERLDTVARTITPEDLMLQSFSVDISNVHGTYRLFEENREQVARAIKALMDGECLYLIGLRESYALTHYAWTRFGHIRRNVQVIGAYGNLYEDEILNVTPKDVVLAFTFPRYARDTIYLLEKLHERSVPIIIVTDTAHEPLDRFSELILPCQLTSISHKLDTIGAYAAINFLSTAAAMDRYYTARVSLAEALDINQKNPTIL